MRKFTFDMDQLRKYVNGELSAREMHEIERAAHEDEMLMDILMGMEIEKEHGSDPILLHSIRQQIDQRTQQQSLKRPIWYNRYLQIAASIILLATVGILFWNQQNNTPKTEQAMASKAPESISAPTQADILEATANDSTNQVLSHVTPQPSTTHPENRQSEEQASSGNRSLTPHEKHILAYTPVEKNVELSQDIAETLNLGHPKHESDVIMINTEATDKSNLLASNSRRQLQSKVPDARVSVNPNNTPSAAQMRARLSNMGLDPQTSFILGQVIDQQSRQPLAGAAVKDLQNDNVVVTDAEGRFAYAANSKKNLEINANGYNAREIAAESGEQTILLSPKENRSEEVDASGAAKINKSIPSVGWEKYLAYFHEELAKHTSTNYTFNIQMELDKKGTPIRISVLKSSDKTLNSKVISLVEKGPSWKRGTDWKNIYLQIKSL
ncbi:MULTISPECIES: carboxypeptidase-like regulatory domain-containing protein [Sphingobacterium]|uniref:carboxypeptidase-like regulatory domain-containing protein n=1 Tax=Sphingobacterium TaxID=28453 RepID=UPI0013D94B89|nr:MULTISPECIES: carboxypeptidase-like regulatory domain-containing protein [unclassified Sphingobacterium]